MSHCQKFPQDDTLSPKLDSLSCAELLKKNLPTSKALHSLRMKIQQQKLRREISTPAPGEKDRQHLTRKICRVSNKEAKASPGTGGVIRLAVRKNTVNADYQRSDLRAEHSTYISAWRNAQGLVKLILNSPCSAVSQAERVSIKDQRDWSNKKASQQLVVLNAQTNSSNQMKKDENSSKKHPSPLRSQAQVLYSPASGKTFISHAASSYPVKAVPLANRNHCSQNSTSEVFAKNCDIAKTTEPLVAGKENESQMKSNRQPRHNIQELREYMHHQAVERRRKVLQMRKEAQREDERKQRNMHEVIKKQRQVLHRAKREQQQEYKNRGSSEEKKRCAHVADTTEEQLSVFPRQNQSVTVAEQVDQGSGTLGEAGSPVSAADAKWAQNALATHRHREEALRKTISALDTHMADEAAWLRITDHKVALRQSQPAGQGICGAKSRETLSDHVSLDTDKETNHRQERVSIKKEIKDEKYGVDMGLCAADCRPQIDQTEKGQEEQSDSSESTDSTSKWSELSELYSQRLLSHLSLAQSQQFLREEELRARQYSALFRLREKALWEKTQAELDWLEHSVNHGTAQDDILAFTELKQKQEEVIHRFQQEQAEIHYWRNMYRSGRHQRRLLLHHQRDILHIKQSAIRLRQALQIQTLPNKNGITKPENTSSYMEEEGVMQPGIKPDTRSTDKAPREEGSLLGKAGLRRLLSSDEVWTLGRKRNQVEFVPAEQDILQVAESNNPPASPSHRYSRQNQASLHLISPERISKTEGGSTSCQRDSVKALKSGPEVNEQDTQKKVQGLYEDTCTLKRERLQHPSEVPMKPVLNIHHFTLNREPHSDSLRAPIVSSLSSDKKDDLRLDPKKSHLKPKEQEDIKTTNVVHGSTTADTTALNVQNNQRLHSVLTLNNNHNICDQDAEGQWKSSLSYSKTDKTNEFPEQKPQACTNETVTDNPLIENLILEAVSVEIRKAEDSPSCDVSLSEIDEKSEAVSFHSEALAWSEEERDCLDEEKIEAAQASSCSLVFAEKYTVVPDDSHPYLNNKQEGRCTPPCYERQATVESTLSEILSPVDEVLSYGSAELPPSVKGGAASGLDSYGCPPPPPPAFEIITWTSEEELPAPPDSVDDLSINSENLPPLPVDFSLKRKESQSLDSNSLREKEVNDDTNGALCEDAEENDCSEYTGSLPEDARNEFSDPLSSFQIGDRVLVCNSRPGVLKYKGLTVFANGFWAGVALDTPNGNHNGTFRGVKYFSCNKSHGVLVRAEDIAHIHREHSSDVETGVDEDPFSDEEQPRAKRDKQQKDTSSADGQRGHQLSQYPPRDETIPTNSTRTRQKEPQEDMSDGARNLSHAFEMPSTRQISILE
ncbi:centrosome-associated protein 350 isoform X4 [Onychostoma macrolepis]|uniref:centrosome-associated protein 350 isoform X4 n=1 Tax=Onychostoma macrolepis TaxID=369639 RepID=UPI00272D6697|nr:centrosome-associated protein 350 isoform X4 [Onychostoma macrolepis]